jgi:phosphate transport system substrate-binding protein
LLGVQSACAPSPAPPPTPQPAHLRLAGDKTMHPLAQALIAAYAEQYPQVSLSLESGAERDGLGAVRARRADIGLVARPLASSEQGDLIATPIGLDAIVITVNAKNPVKALSLEQLRKLYGGEMYDWTALGGRKGDVQIVSRDATSDTRRAFEDKVMALPGSAAGKRVTLQAVVVPDDEAVADYILANELAIGYLSAVALRPGLKGLFVEGVSPDESAVRKGAYPLARPLLMVTGAEPSEPVRAFMAFVLSPAGQAVVERYHVRIQ